ncbi:MAG TPA: hypothetical protein VEA37_00475, partial [Flavobacterium sp.]|nr:hypothetical protein [Flavobacterium sp.]
SYRSFGSAFDLAASFDDTAKMFVASLVVKNIGYQFVPYTKGNHEPLPFEIQVGASKRFEHLPFRLSILAHNLQKLNIRYDDPARRVDDVLLTDTAENTGEKKYIADKIARHFIVSGEFYFGKALRITFGYNHLRRQELAYPTKKGLAGISFGAGITVKKIQISYARGQYNAAGGVNHFSISTNLNEFAKKVNRQMD